MNLNGLGGRLDRIERVIPQRSCADPYHSDIPVVTVRSEEEADARPQLAPVCPTCGKRRRSGLSELIIIAPSQAAGDRQALENPDAKILVGIDIDRV